MAVAHNVPPLLPPPHFSGVGKEPTRIAPPLAQLGSPVYRGDPGYGPHLDRDNDGIGCE